MKNETYHFESQFTGEIVKDLPELIHTVLHTLRYYREWSLAEKTQFVFCWKYSRQGF